MVWVPLVRSEYIRSVTDALLCFRLRCAKHEHKRAENGQMAASFSSVIISSSSLRNKKKPAGCPLLRAMRAAGGSVCFQQPSGIGLRTKRKAHPLCGFKSFESPTRGVLSVDGSRSQQRGYGMKINVSGRAALHAGEL